MSMFAPLFAGLSPLSAGMLDAGILALLFSAPLWVICYQLPVRQLSAQQIHSQRMALFSRLLAVVCLSEFIVMFFLLSFVPQLTGLVLALVDAIFSALLVLPTALVVDVALCRTQRQTEPGRCPPHTGYALYDRSLHRFPRRYDPGIDSATPDSGRGG